MTTNAAVWRLETGRWVFAVDGFLTRSPNDYPNPTEAEAARQKFIQERGQDAKAATEELTKGPKDSGPNLATRGAFLASKGGRGPGE